MMRTDMDKDVARDETATLIASDKVEGTPVFGMNRERIGSIENFMVDKLSGHVAYAVLSFGGFLGLGSDHYPLPWSTLKYDEGLGGYVVNVSREQLDRAPKYANDESWDWANNSKQLETYYMAGM
jgi:hypothetical protein